MKPVSPKALVLALLLAVLPAVSGAVPDPLTWQSSVVGTNNLMVINGGVSVNDFMPLAPDNSLIGVFVPTLPNQAVGVVQVVAGGSFSLTVNGNTGSTTQNGALGGEHLQFYYFDNVAGLVTPMLDPGITFAGTTGTPYIYPTNASLQVYYPPTITAFDNAAPAGAEIVLTGANFCGYPAHNVVLFNGVRATGTRIVGSDHVHMYVTVPAGAQSGPISIETPGGTFATSSSFTVLPRITGFTPASGVRGDVVTVNGNNFGSAPSLSVAGTAVGASAISVVNDNQFTFAIPGDVVSGVLSVTTSEGTGTGGGSLTIFPTITGISPPSGGVGDVVTISGYNFDNTSTGATQVSFGGNVPATIDWAASGRTSLAVRVPGGALDGPLTVATAAGSAISADSFSITSRHFADPVPTPFTVPLSGSVKKNGAAAPAGDEVAVFSVHPKALSPGKWEKTLVAHATILSDGTLSAMPVYGDDPVTTDNVEGCVPGEEMLLALWSASEGKAYYAVLDGASGLPVSLAWDNASIPPPVDLNFVEGQRIPLRTGSWNLISVGVLRGVRATGGQTSPQQLAGATYDNVASMELAAPLKSIEGKYDRVMGSDGSGVRSWNPAQPLFATLKSLQPGYGYWVKAKASPQPLVWMTFPGPMARGDETLDLKTGWTLLGYWGNERVYHDPSIAAPAALLLPVSASDNVQVATVGDVWAGVSGNYDRVIAFDTGVKLWNPAQPGFATMKYLGPGYGYWIRMRSDQTLAYPAGTR